MLHYPDHLVTCDYEVVNKSWLIKT